METYSDVNAGRLRSFKPLLRAWTELQECGARTLGTGDAPWWYNERASLSIFAGAIWRSGGYVIEEHATDKAIRRGAVGRPRHSRGRGDIYFRFSRKHYIGEAKQLWPALNTRSPNSAQTYVEGAVRDAQHRTDDAHRCLALVFLSPTAPRSASTLDEPIKTWIARLNSVPDVALAWVFPRSRRTLAEGGAFYPGAALLIKLL